MNRISSLSSKAAARLATGAAVVLIPQAPSILWSETLDVPTAWQLLNDGDPNPGSGTLAYDSNRNRSVRTTTGGPSSPPFTWELVGDDWVRRFIPEPTPWGAGGACSAFDSDRGKVVIFGGVSNETWEYDGNVWTKRNPVHSPPSRDLCGLVYDSMRHRAVLFGGFSASLFGLGDHWEYDGTDWAQVLPRDIPSPRWEEGLAYDRDRQRVVLFGGRNNNNFLNDTWEYDGRNWRLKTPTTSPVPRWAPGMTYDPARMRTVLFGGNSYQGDKNDTWEWNGTNWTQVVTAQAPAPRAYFRLIYDSGRGKVVGTGGSPNDGAYNDTWAYDGTNWSQIAISGLPYVRTDSAIAYDPSLDSLVVYGGNTVGLYMTDTWHFSNDSWALQTSVGAPTASYNFGLAYDASASRLIGFSGIPAGQSVPTVDTYEYKGSPRQWSSMNDFGPEKRERYGWANAPALGGTVLFGGNACCVGAGAYFLIDDTWILRLLSKSRDGVGFIEQSGPRGSRACRISGRS